MNEMEDNTAYLLKRVWRKYLGSALVSELGLFIFQSLGVFFLVSRYCPESDLVVFAVFLPFLQFFNFVDAFFALGAPQAFALRKAADDAAGAQNLFAEALTAALLLFPVLFGGLALAVRPIAGFMNVPPELTDAAVRYGALYFLAGGVASFANLIRNFLRADSRPLFAALLHTCGIGLLLVLTIVFICFLHSGVLGFIYAYLSVYATIALVCLGVFAFGSGGSLALRFRFPRPGTLRTVFLLASGNFVVIASLFVGGVLINRWLLEVFGASAVAVMGLKETVAQWPSAFSNAYEQTLQTLAGMFRGERNFKGVRLAVRKAVGSAAALQTALALGTIFAAPLIVRWMPVPENWAGEAVWALRWMAVAQVLVNLYQLLVNFYAVCEHAAFVSVTSFLTQGATYLAVTAAFLYGWGSERAFWAAESVAAALYLVVLYAGACWKGRRRDIYSGPLLLPVEEDSDPVLHLLLDRNVDHLALDREMVGLFLGAHGVPPAVQMRMELLFEELFVFAGENMRADPDEKVSVSVTVGAGSNIEIAVRYESDASCLESVLAGCRKNIDPDTVCGARILRGLSDRFYIDRIYGINYVKLELVAKKASGPAARNDVL